MSWAQYLYSYIKNQSIVTAGRWLMSLTMIGLAFSPSVAVAFVVVGVSALLQGGITWLKQRDAENQLVVDYRDELSAKTGIDPSKLTTKELDLVAYGDRDKGIEANPVLAQAVERSGNRKFMSWGTLVVAAFATMALFLPFLSDIENVVKPLLAQAKIFLEPYGLTGVVPQHAGVFTMMLVSGTGMGLLNNVFERVTERVIGLNRRTAHEQIQEIRRDIDKNQIIIPQQVFGVFVALDPKLDQQIRAMFIRPYEKLNVEEQHDALLIFGRHLQNPQLGHHSIASLTRDLNNRQIEADELAFAVVGQDSGVPRLEKPQPRGKPKSEIEEFVQEVKQVVKGQKRYEAEEKRAEVRQQQELVAEAASNDNVPGFAQRFVPRESGVTSHVERAGVAPRDTQSSHLEREMQRLIAKLDEQKNR